MTKKGSFDTNLTQREETVFGLMKVFDEVAKLRHLSMDISFGSEKDIITLRNKKGAPVYRRHARYKKSGLWIFQYDTIRLTSDTSTSPEGPFHVHTPEGRAQLEEHILKTLRGAKKVRDLST